MAFATRATRRGLVLDRLVTPAGAAAAVVVAHRPPNAVVATIGGLTASWCTS